MKLIHFSDMPVKFDPNWRYMRRPDQYDNGKPLGLWVSDEDEHGWSKWCEAEEWGLGDLEYKHLVTLKPDTNILFLRTTADIDLFTAKYLNPNSESYFQRIDWQRVYKLYQGVIITPYQWSRRLSEHTFWYNGWDCASGVIWDLSAIEKFEIIKSKKRVKEAA